MEPTKKTTIEVLNKLDYQNVLTPEALKFLFELHSKFSLLHKLKFLRSSLNYICQKYYFLSFLYGLYSA